MVNLASLTDRQQKFIVDNWTKMSNQTIADAIGRSKSFTSAAAHALGCIHKFKKGADSSWTAADVELIFTCIKAGMKTAEMRRVHFPSRSYDAVKEKIYRARHGTLNAPKDAKTRVSIPGVSKQEDHKPKVMALEPLRYTRECCPRVTLEYACQWMRQQVKGWERPQNDRDAWRAVNNQRINGPIPVPPFLPISMPRMHDTHRHAPIDLPAQSVGAAG